MSALSRILFGWALAFGVTAAPVAMGDSHETTITAHGISSFGDLKYPADFTHFDYANLNAPQGGTMSFRGTLASTTFDSLNYFILKGEPAQQLERIYDTLLARAYDEPDAYYGLLAETITYPEDRSWVDFTLRDGAVFSDGHPVTAEDVVFTFERVKADGMPRFQLLFKDVATVTALSHRNVRFDFADGAATRDMISRVGEFPIAPAHFYDTVDFTESSLEPPLGSGPYVVSDVKPGQQVTYCKNPDYWGADLPVNRGKDNFDCIRLEYFSDRTAAFEALKSGAYLFHEEFSSASWGTAYDFPALDNDWVIREEIEDGRPSGAQGFWFNMRRPQFQDRRVREAIGLMFNFEFSNQTLFYGYYNRTDSFWENSEIEAQGLPEGDELAFLEQFRNGLPDTVFTEPAYTPPVNGTTNLDRRAARSAGALLDAAGWTADDGGDGLRRNAEGETLKAEFLLASPAFERIVIPYIENLRTVGIDARYELIDFAQYEQRQETFDYDIIVGRLVFSLSPSVELRSAYGSQSADQPGTFNFTGIADPVIDDIIEAVIAAPDRDTLNTRISALDRVMRDRMIWTPQWSKGTHWIAYWDVFGRPDIKPTFDRGTDWWWWEEDKYQALQDAGALR